MWPSPEIGVASFEFVARLDDLSNLIAFGCPDLFQREGRVLVADWCVGPELRIFDPAGREELEAPVFDFPRVEASPGLWFLEAGGAQVFMQFDAEGNIGQAVTDAGIDVVGDDYAGLAAISSDGRFFIYSDHSQSPSPHFSNTVRMRQTSDGQLAGTWQIEGVVDSIQSDGRWLLITELNEEAAIGGDATIAATTVVDLETDSVTRVEAPYEIFLAR